MLVLALFAASLLHAIDINPNTSGLPGLNVVRLVIGALMTLGLLAAAAGIVLGAIQWAIGSSSSNPSLASRGKATVVWSVVGAALIGGAVALVNFFTNLGGQI